MDQLRDSSKKSSDAGEEEENRPSESLQKTAMEFPPSSGSGSPALTYSSEKKKKRDSQCLQETAMESSPSSGSGSPALMDLTTSVKDSAEKADSVQEADTEVRSFCF